MRPHRILLLVPLALALVLGSSPGPLNARTAADIPASLTDREFWQLTEDLSEPDGTFRSDNVLSNEMVFARNDVGVDTIAELLDTVYLPLIRAVSAQPPASDPAAK